MHAIRQIPVLIVVLGSVGLDACSGSSNPISSTGGGTTATDVGGSSSVGGNANKDGGAASLGGRTNGAGTGGALAAGGLQGVGGKASTGGEASTGGRLSTGGADATGGAMSTGGRLATGGSAASCHAAGTLTVTNQGTTAYVIDGTANPTLTLCRGSTYTFAINAPGHPFYIKTIQGTGTTNAYSGGVTGNGATSGNVTFAVDSAAPNTLFYDCSIHAAMAGTLNIVN